MMRGLVERVGVMHLLGWLKSQGQMNGIRGGGGVIWGIHWLFLGLVAIFCRYFLFFLTKGAYAIVIRFSSRFD